MANWTQQRQFLDFFAKHGVTHFNLAALCAGGDGGRRVFKGEDRARDRAEAERSFGWAWHENAGGAEIYVRPARWLPSGSPGRWPVVFLDDVSPAAAAQIAGEFAAAVIETSPGRCHVWLAVSRPLDEAERKALQQRLIAEHGGDPASSGGEHFGRMPGFRNHKRGGVFANIKTIGDGKLYLYPVSAVVPTPAADGGKPGGACASQSRSNISNISSGGGNSESEREFGFVIGRLRWLSQRDSAALSVEAERLISEITARAAGRGKAHPADYAKRTVAAALARL